MTSTNLVEEENKIHVNFNQDSTSLAVGTKTGYKLFDLRKVDQLDPLYEDNSGHTFIVERLFSSSLLAIVSLSAPRKFKICHFKKNTEIAQNSYQDTILAIKLNRLRLVICLVENIYIHNISDLQLVHSIKYAPRNPKGLIALAPSNERCYLAYPAKSTSGEVHIFDAFKLENKLTIAAHDNPLVCMAFDSVGAKLATASEKGTVIRVFDTHKGDCIYEFRRGFARCVSIYSLSFSADSLFLCASSNTETVHIFKLTECKPNEDDGSFIFQKFRKAIQSASYLTSVADMMSQWRSFAVAKLPLCGPKSICTITNTMQPSASSGFAGGDGVSGGGGGSSSSHINQGNLAHVLIASTDGYLYVYELNMVEGGECALVRQHRLVDDAAGLALSGSSLNLANQPPASIDK